MALGAALPPRVAGAEPEREGPWQEPQRCRIVVACGIVGGAPTPARSPRTGGWSPAKVLSSKGIAPAGGAPGIGPAETTWHCTHDAWVSWQIAGATCAATRSPSPWQVMQLGKSC